MNRFAEIGETLSLQTDAMFLDALKKLYREKRSSAILFGALKFCAERKLAMPDWIAREVIAGVAKIQKLEVGTWDAAFGPPLPAGKQLGAMRKRLIKQVPVWRRVRELKGDAPLDHQLFDRVGAEFKIGGSTAKNYYYDVESCPEFFGLGNF